MINDSGMDIEEIRRYLPHRYPFLLLDRVLEVDPAKSIKAVKNVSVNEPFFQGHFPGKAIMPGVLVVEAMAQASGILAVKHFNYLANRPDEPEKDGIYFFVGIDKARFRKIVLPGDQLIIDVEILRSRRGIWSFSGKVTANDKVVCDAEFMCTQAGKGNA